MLHMEKAKVRGNQWPQQGIDWRTKGTETKNIWNGDFQEQKLYGNNQEKRNRIYTSKYYIY